jgi:hypothetical protein
MFLPEIQLPAPPSSPPPGKPLRPMKNKTATGTNQTMAQNTSVTAIAALSTALSLVPGPSISNKKADRPERHTTDQTIIKMVLTFFVMEE